MTKLYKQFLMIHVMLVDIILFGCSFFPNNVNEFFDRAQVDVDEYV